MLCQTELTVDITKVESFFGKNNTHRGIAYAITKKTNLAVRHIIYHVFKYRQHFLFIQLLLCV